MDGILIIDKPAGPTSHDVVQIVKRITGARKVGHLGTLDPAATGVLPLAIDGATKFASSLSGREKTYEFTLCLGVVTDTDDNAGRVLATAPLCDDIMGRLEAALPHFIGRIMQRPPAYSAKKVEGRRAYELARRGMEVPVEPKAVIIKNLYITSICTPNVNMMLECETGTYVRALCRDIGEYLGCGAHAAGIRRLRSGPYIIDEAVTLDELKEHPGLWVDRILPVDQV